MTTVSLGVLGAIFGSFLDVLALRYDPGKPLFGRHTLGGRSQCPGCGHILRWFELIPVASFLIQRGRCRACGASISFENVFVEMLSAAIFVLVPRAVMAGAGDGIYLHGAPLAMWGISAIWIAAFLALLLITLIDIRHRIIPDEANIMLIVLGLVLACVEGATLLAPHRSFMGAYGLLFGAVGLQGVLGALLNRLVGFAVGGGLFAALVALTRGRGMGMGDVKLIAALGVLFGWPDILVLSALAFIVGSLVSIVLMLVRGLTRKSAVPFGPFIAAGAVIIFFFGVDIAAFYFSFIM